MRFATMVSESSRVAPSRVDDRPILILTTGAAPDKSPDGSRPRSALFHPFLIACDRLGFKVECRRIGAVAQDRRNDRPPGWWTPYKSALKLATRLDEYQAIVAYGSVGAALAFAAAIRPGRSAAVAVVSFSNVLPTGRVANRLRAIWYKLGLRAAAVTIFMTEAQRIQAVRRLGCPPGKADLLPVGVDTEFFCPKAGGPEPSEINRDLRNFCRNPYIVVAGDQQRNEREVLNTIESLGTRLVRLTQNTYTEAFWKSYGSDPDRDSVFCKAHLPWTDVRFAYQHASALVSLADNSWQPAGWTTVLEAMASGIPVLVRRGLITEELKRYCGPNDQLPFSVFDDLCGIEVAEAFGRLMTCRQMEPAGVAEHLKSFVESNFTIEGVSGAAADIIEHALKNRHNGVKS
jgi:glycosyltransferase involved in cell wall biosynthesis